MRDSHGNPLASVLEIGPHPFVVEDVVRLPDLLARLRDLSDRELRPVLRLSDPSGTEVRAGTIPWEAQPFTFDMMPDDVVAGVYDTRLVLDTGPLAGQQTAEATLIVPARSLSAETVAPGETFTGEVRFDAPLVAEGDVTLSEDLPNAFTIVDWIAQPPVVRGDYGDGSWTWHPSGRSRYQAGGIVRVTYTIRVDQAAAPGAYEIHGEVRHAADGLVRTVAGERTVTVAAG